MGNSYLIIFVLIAIGFVVPSAFADHTTASVSTPQGTSVPGCETTNECFVPYEVTVDVGGVVTWSNDDSAAHTVTAGSAADGPSGVFDSSLFMAGTTFSHTFEAAGEFPYHCMVHPWMMGIVTVTEASTINSSIKITGTSHTIDYSISGGNIISITPDNDAGSLIIALDTFSDGTLTIEIPRSLLDAKIGNNDDDYFVLVNGLEVNYSETSTTSSYRTLKINFSSLTDEIEILGTKSQDLPEPVPTPPPGTDVVIPQGTSVPGCENSNSCYLPYFISIQKGETVSWFNQDSVAHTVTAGSAADGPSGVFDSSTFMAGTTFSHKFDSAGEYPYFCMVHPWMEGIVSVIDDTPSGPPITVKTDLGHYNDGDIIYVSGQVSEILFGYAISVMLIAPNGNAVSIDQAMVDSNGNYQIQLDAGGSLMREDGTYTIQVLYGTENRTAETDFTFRASTANSQLSLNTDKNSYYQGETINVSGWVSSPSFADSVTLMITNPDNEITTLTQAKPESNGSYQKKIVISGSNWNTEGWFFIEATFGTAKENTRFFVESTHISEEPSPPSPPPAGGFASVSTPQGTSVPGCESTNECFIPYEVRISTGGEVTWSNNDSAAHTVTAGSAADGPSGLFDSSLFMAGTTFSHKFESSGTYPYFCMVHPWMQGFVTVGQGGPTPSSINVKTDKTTYYFGDTLKITGVLQPADGSSVFLQIVNPLGNIVYNESASSFSSGLFSEDIRLTGSIFAETGTYSVKASANSATDTTEFVLREKILTPPPSGDSASVSTPQGTSVPGCESTNECFIPFVVAIDAGGVVKWSNDDSAAHTVTAGSAADGPSGVFDSSLFMAGTTFSHTFSQSGTYPYFCMVHPWMEGIVIVGNNPIPPPDSPISLSVSSDQSIYDLGEIVRLTIGISGSSGTQNVAVSVTDPTGTSVISRSLSISPNNSESIEFRISEDFKTGSYRITASTSDGVKTVTETAYFKIKSQFNSFKITSVDATNQQGNPSGLEAGEIGFIKVNLNSEKQIATLVTVNIFDSNLSSIGIGSVKTTLSSGNSEIILSFMIPENVSLGPAMVYVNAFSDWPSNGGIALTPEFAATEDIS